MLIREVADNTPLQAPGSKVAEPSKGWLVFCVRPATAVTRPMWTERSILPASQDSKTKSKVRRCLIPAFCSYCKPAHPPPRTCSPQAFLSNERKQMPKLLTTIDRYQFARQTTQILQLFSAGVLLIISGTGTTWRHHCSSVGLWSSLRVRCSEGARCLEDAAMEVGASARPRGAQSLKGWF